ncbi:recombinase family protein [Pontibacillus salipaludis]|uniref:Recombinase RecB n=1 Tax=Pontibacillus salipaludis TaxID=1697394 RepID=A0ABQ1PSJ9_9BACI|nr:recombinase family protein [Pontibacillus salipaludis]GGD02335.1 recombinase RecB [Pontibacillus salipaludis]
MKAALYVRVSTEEQADDGYSIDGQIQSLKEYCTKMNHEIVEVYKDEGISAKSLNRPALQKMLRDLNSNNFDLILTWKFSRISRKQVDLLNVIEDLVNHNVTLYSVSENIDYNTSHGKVMMQILGSFAEFERNQMVENVTLGMKQRAREGKWNGGSVLGYKSEDKELYILEEEAETVRKIFSLYLEGKGYKAIANHLNHRGYKTKKNRQFSVTSVRTILHNPVYVGYIRFNQVENWNEKRRSGTNSNPIVVEGSHEPLITKDTWERTQELIRKKSHKPSKSFYGTFPLTTLLRCPQCGQGMISHKSRASKNSDEYIRYYKCSTFSNKGSAACKSNTVNADYIEGAVFKRLEEIVSTPNELEQIVEEINSKVKSQKDPLYQDLEQIDTQLKKINNKKAKYEELFDNEDLSASYFKEKINTFIAEENDLLEQRENIQNEIDKPTMEEVSFSFVHDSLKKFSKLLPKVPAEQQKHFLHNMINRITLISHEDRRIEDVELYFDTSKKTDDFVFTYGTVHLY